MDMSYFNKQIPVVVAVGLCVMLAFSNPVKSGNRQSGQHRPSPYPVIPQRDFLHVWNGSETCNNQKDQHSSAVTLTALDSTGVYISGLFNANDSVEGKIRGYMVIITKQQIRAMAKGATIEGSLSLSNDRKTLKGFFTKQLNGQTDSCAGVYHYKQ
jgi:hypothetical protein